MQMFFIIIIITLNKFATNFLCMRDGKFVLLFTMVRDADVSSAAAGTSTNFICKL